MGGREPQCVDRPSRRRSACPAQPERVVRDVHESGAVVEKLADGDLVSLRNDAGQVALERVAKAKPSLRGELEHNRGRERLGDAPDAKSLVPARTTSPRRGHVLSTIVGDEDDHAGRAGTRELLRHTFDRRRRA